MLIRLCRIFSFQSFVIVNKFIDFLYRLKLINILIDYTDDLDYIRKHENIL